VLSHMGQVATARMSSAQAFWIAGFRKGQIRPAALASDAGLVEVATLFTGISRGTESLVFDGAVPESEWDRMRCPFQEGQFSFPIKYGYAAVGVVVAGPEDIRGRTVFVLHPHQDRFLVPAAMAIPVPAEVPVARAVLAANTETAINIVWDARVAPGDRVAVVGAGVVGALVGWLCARIPGTAVTLVDINEDRRALASTLGCDFAMPDAAPRDCDVVVHASATGEGLATAIASAGIEARIVEASWYGNRPVTLDLGGAFHSRRLQLIGSQVGQLPTERRPRWNHARRLKTALGLLADDRLDALISGETPFERMPDDYARILAEPGTLCHRIRYKAHS